MITKINRIVGKKASMNKDITNQRVIMAKNHGKIKKVKENQTTTETMLKMKADTKNSGEKGHTNPMNHKKENRERGLTGKRTAKH